MSRIRSFTAFATGMLFTGGALLAHDPHDPMVVVAVSPNFAQDHTVLAATGGLTLKLGAILLLKSADSGVNWTVAAGLPNNSPIYSVVFSPAYALDQTVFVGGAGGLFVSNDGANTWTTLSADFLVSVALSPNFSHDNTLFAVTNTNKLLKSLNRGVTLNPITAPVASSALGIIAVSPNFTVDKTLLLGSVSSGIFKSSNTGHTWLSVTGSFNVPNVTALVFSPSFSTDKTAFAGTFGAGVLVSTTGANSWSLSDTGLSDLDVSSLALSPTFTQDSTLWVTTAAGGVFQSTARGAVWGQPTTVPRAPSDLTTVHYQYIAAAPGIQFLGMFEGLWISNNAGPWQYVDTCPTRIIRYINMSPNYPVDQTIFASTYGSGNLWSTDGGVSWTLQNNGMQAPYTDASGISPNFANDGTAFSGNHLGLQRTIDSGATWQMMVGPGTTAYPRGLAVSPNFALDQTVYIGTTSASGHSTHLQNPEEKLAAGLYISKDAGATWTPSSLIGKGVIAIAFSPAFATDRTAFAATQQQTLSITTNSAATWTPLTLPGNPNGVATVAVSPNFAVDRTVFAAALHGGIYMSTNAGTSWTMLPSTRPIRGLIIVFSPNYAIDQTLFIGTIQGGLMKSTNGGATLANVPSFPDVFVSAVGVSSGFATDQTVFAAGYHGLFKSTDGGSTWIYMNNPARVEESRNSDQSLQSSGTDLEEPPTITYQGAWSMFMPSTPASTNQFGTTSVAEDTATLNFLGTGVAWVSLTGFDQGSASIALDGVYQTTVNLNTTSNPDLYLQTVWQQQGLACGNHTLTITALAGFPQEISLDAFDIWLANCPYTTFGNATRQAAAKP